MPAPTRRQALRPAQLAPRVAVGARHAGPRPHLGVVAERAVRRGRRALRPPERKARQVPRTSGQLRLPPPRSPRPPRTRDRADGGPVVRARSPAEGGAGPPEEAAGRAGTPDAREPGGGSEAVVPRRRSNRLPGRRCRGRSPRPALGPRRGRAATPAVRRPRRLATMAGDARW